MKLTLVSVKYGSNDWLLANIKLSQALNPNQPYEWLVVNNDDDATFTEQARAVRVLPGVKKTPSTDRGSYHHAAAIMSALPEVKTRFLLLLDHDFFVIRANWMLEILTHMQVKKLAFFGSTWHPKWSYQYRYFPSVHFMLIDLDQIPLEKLDFLPDIGGGWWDNLISYKKLPIPKFMRQSLQVGQFRDTGFRVRQAFGDAKFECLIPHYDPELATLEPLQRLMTRVLPDQFNLIPQRTSSYTTKSFLQGMSEYAYEQQWEEFFWQTQPFGFHLRMVGRGTNEQDLVELEQLLNVHLTKR